MSLVDMQKFVAESPAFQERVARIVRETLAEESRSISEGIALIEAVGFTGGQAASAVNVLWQAGWRSRPHHASPRLGARFDNIPATEGADLEIVGDVAVPRA